MNYLSASISVVALLTAACGGATEGRFDHQSDETSSSDQPPAQAGAGAEVYDVSCQYLHGNAFLEDRQNSDYASAAFSFKYGSQDPDVTHNDFDIEYDRDTFMVSIVTDDKSFIVDLGAVPLRETPATVDLNNFPVGKWGQHDAIDAQINHTYFVRLADGSGRHVAAFRVTGLEPGRRVGIEWVTSTDPDVMVLPMTCL